MYSFVQFFDAARRHNRRTFFVRCLPLSQNLAVKLNTTLVGSHEVLPHPGLSPASFQNGYSQSPETARGARRADRRTETRSAGLEQNRASIECQLHASASFPVLTLPAEVTAEIFVHCLTLHGMRWSVPTYGIENIAPVVLMGVCRTWRDIALTTPALWSSLDLRFDRFSPEGIPYRVFSKPGLVEGFIDRWLARAGIFPLSLIFGASKYAIEDRFTPSRMRDVIHRYSHRLRYLELDMSLLNVYQLGLDLAEFPLLQSARLGSGLDPDPPPSIYSVMHPAFTN
ncbi:hypothetical protein B0H13DRAFT_896328 [Mycena leptocephala]|nr:hypothetical protein B0H13DRAFT_896328 [Mycena leptocephala]